MIIEVFNSKHNLTSLIGKEDKVSDSNRSVQIAVALITTIGVIVTALITNLDKVFLPKAKIYENQDNTRSVLPPYEQSAKPVTQPNIAGVWTFPGIGKLKIYQHGTQIKGYFFYNQPRGHTATINGTVQGSKFDFTWYFSLDLKGKSSPQGTGLLELQSDGKTMIGYFTDKSNTEAMPSTLSRDNQTPECSLAGEWTCPFIGKLIIYQNNNQITGRFTFTNPQISDRIVEGSYANQQLKFSWYNANDPNGSQNLQGKGLLEIAPDCSTMVGYYTERNNPNEMPWVLIR